MVQSQLRVTHQLRSSRVHLTTVLFFRMRTAPTPWEQTPPWDQTHQTPPGADPPGPDTPQDQTPPEQTHTPGTRHPPGADTHPRNQTPWDQTPPCEQNDRQVQKYYLAPNFVCGR